MGKSALRIGDENADSFRDAIMRLLTLQNNEANSDQALQEIIYELYSGVAKTVTVMNPRENRTFSKY